MTRCLKGCLCPEDPSDSHSWSSVFVVSAHRRIETKGFRLCPASPVTTHLITIFLSQTGCLWRIRSHYVNNNNIDLRVTDAVTFGWQNRNPFIPGSKWVFEPNLILKLPPRADGGKPNKNTPQVYCYCLWEIVIFCSWHNCAHWKCFSVNENL